MSVVPTTLEVNFGQQMDDLTVSTGRTSHGLRNVLLENRRLRVEILPEAGARIWQITYKPLGAELLWNNPSVSPRSTATPRLL